MAETIRMQLEQLHDYQFASQFAGHAERLMVDLPPPLGAGQGLSPEQLLLAAVTNCHAASLLFALRKYHDRESSIRGEAECQVDRNEQGRLRVTSITVSLTLGLPAAGYRKNWVWCWRSLKTTASFRRVWRLAFRFWSTCMMPTNNC